MDLKTVVKKISAIKIHRNNLIQGTWEIYRKKNVSDVFVSVRKGRSQFLEGKQGYSADVWTSGTTYEYQFDELRDLQVSIVEVVEHLKALLIYFKDNKPYI